MNLLLLEPGEVQADGTCTLQGRRALHLREVLGVTRERKLRIGLRDGALGQGLVLGDDGEVVRLSCAFEAAAPARSEDALLLAVPRPKVLLRVLEHSAALGFSRIILFRSWRVEKSCLQSRAMQPEVQQEHLRLGLEQGMRTHLPEVRFFPLFRPFVEDHLDSLHLPALRCVGDPEGLPAAALGIAKMAPLALCLGPEGGLIQYELDQLAARGFRLLSLGPHPLRTETALAALWGQLDLLRRCSLQEAP